MKFSAQITTAPIFEFNATAGLCPTGRVTSFTIDDERSVLHGFGQGVAFQPWSPHWNPQAWFTAPLGVYFGTLTLTCEDGSGSITLSWQGPGSLSDFFEGVTGRFTVTGGTGAYATLGGHGSATIGVPNGLIAHFDGTFWFEG
jgi:hypothetical protein